MSYYDDATIMSKVKPFTMTSSERLLQTLNTIDRVIKNNIEGDIIEVGVWRGGTVMAMLMKLKQLGATDRHVHLYDTFEGEKDVNPEGPWSWRGVILVPGLKCDGNIEDVMENVLYVGYPSGFIHFHKGDIRQVDLSKIPEKIACLRLDVEGCELYKFCLSVFEPRVQPNGPVTIAYHD